MEWVVMGFVIGMSALLVLMTVANVWAIRAEKQLAKGEDDE